MTIEQVYSRVAAIESLIPAQAGTVAAAPVASFAGVLAAASSSKGNGNAIVAAAKSQLGATEQPPGSNDGPQIATYRSAVAGAQAGEPWCAYFASWAAAQAGEPIGSHGQGLGSVSAITNWASSTGRLLPASATPAPGDLILFGDQHVGIVKEVLPNGNIATIEGNYENKVSLNTRTPTEATGYVNMG
jgi:surface antigen